LSFAGYFFRDAIFALRPSRERRMALANKKVMNDNGLLGYFKWWIISPK
jgi:hypothetical protein